MAESRNIWLNLLIKGGSGSGVKGHTTSRMPFPGETTATPSANPNKKKTYSPAEGTEAHYTDTPNLRAYKGIIRGLKRKGLDYNGHITYNPKTDQLETISERGKKMIEDLIAE